MQIGALKPVEAVETTTLTYTIPVQTTQVVAPVAAPVVVEHHLTLQDYLWYAYLAGAIVLLLVLVIKLYTLFKLTRSAQFIEQGKNKVIYLAETDVAFSFLNYLFIGTNAPGANTMIRHELVHIRQRHSADIIFIEVLKIISWFNPCIYLLQNSLKTVHEYIADEQTAAYETDALTYSSFLVNNAYGAGGSSITHSFFNYNLLKKRIIMLNQQRSGNLARLKYLVAVPICAALLCASTLAFSKTYGWVDVMPAKDLPKPQEQRLDMLPKNAYINEFYHDLSMNTKYPAEAHSKNIRGHVIVTFTVADYKLKNIKVVRSIGHGANEEVIKALQNCPQPVNISPGKYAIPFYFSLGGHGHTVDKDDKINEFKGIADGFTFLNEVIIDSYPPPKPKVTQVKFPPPVVKPEAVKITYFINPHGYRGADGLSKISSSLHEAGYQMDFKEIKTNGSNQLQISLETLPGHNWHGSGSATFDMNALKKLNYVIAVGGDNTKQMVYVHSIPNHVKFPPPIVKPDSVTKKVSDAFYDYLRKNIHYPAEARSSNITGKVIITFSVADNKITAINILRGIGHGANEEVTRVLQNYTPDGNMPPGKYAMPVFFALGTENGYAPDPLLDSKADKVEEYKGVANGFIFLKEVVIVGYATQH